MGRAGMTVSRNHLRHDGSDGEATYTYFQATRSRDVTNWKDLENRKLLSCITSQMPVKMPTVSALTLG